MLRSASGDARDARSRLHYRCDRQSPSGADAILAGAKAFRLTWTPIVLDTPGVRVTLMSLLVSIARVGPHRKPPAHKAGFCQDGSPGPQHPGRREHAAKISEQ